MILLLKPNPPYPIASSWASYKNPWCPSESLLLGSQYKDPQCHTPKFFLHLLQIFHTSILKDSSRVDQTNSLLDNQPKLGFGISQIKMDFQHLQWPSCLLICFKDSPCQVSSFTSQVSSDSCSDGWKSVVLVKKSTMVNIQSNFLIFGQHPHFEVTFIIWSRVDHDSSKKTQDLLKSQTF